MTLLTYPQLCQLGRKCSLCDEKATWLDRFEEKGLAYCDRHFPGRVCECEVCKSKGIMNKWIKLKDDFPEEGTHCWLCSNMGNVFDGWYKLIGEMRGFCVYHDTGGSYIFSEEITHWMPYFPPEPPED